MTTTPHTNFDPEDVHTYTQAIRSYEDMTGNFGRFVISKKSGWDDLPLYSLHEVSDYTEYDCSDFWDIFDKVSKIYPTKIRKFLAKVG